MIGRSGKYLAAVTAVAITVSACGGDDTADPATDDSTTPTTPTTTAPVAATTEPTTTTTTAPVTTTSGVATSTTTTPPTTATTTTTTAPLSTTTTTLGPPAQTIAVVGLDGGTVEMDRDAVIPTSQTLIVHDLAPTAPDTGLAVTVEDVGPPAVCESDFEPEEIFLHGNAGDVCNVVLSAPATAAFAAASLTVGIEFVALANISWTIESGPPGSGCYEPGDRLPDLVLRAAGDTDSIFGVGVRSSYFIDPDGNRTESTFGQLDYQELDTGDVTRMVIELSIDPSVPSGSTIGLVIAYSSPGTGVSTSDQPDTFEWRIQRPCP